MGTYSHRHGLGVSRRAQQSSVRVKEQSNKDGSTLEDSAEGDGRSNDLKFGKCETNPGVSRPSNRCRFKFGVQLSLSS